MSGRARYEASTLEADRGTTTGEGWLDSWTPCGDNPGVEELILIVEDDPSLREVIGIGLEDDGFQVATAADGPSALLTFAAQKPALVLLDLMLPGLDGFAVCHELRRVSSVPIIMLTARSATDDVVRGLEAGADDYVTKPFEFPELIARVHSVLRRTAVRGTSAAAPSGQGAPPPHPLLPLGPLTIDPAAHRVTRRGCEGAGGEGSWPEVNLTVTEFRLLYELARHAGQVLTREQLLDLVWGYSYLGDSRLVDVHVQRLRAKIEDDPAHPRLILTVRGVGYRAEHPSAP